MKASGRFEKFLRKRVGIMAQDMFKLIGLEEAPFRLGPDPKYFYRTQNHERAIQRLTKTTILHENCISKGFVRFMPVSV